MTITQYLSEESTDYLLMSSVVPRLGPDDKVEYVGSVYLMCPTHTDTNKRVVKLLSLKPSTSPRVVNFGLAKAIDAIIDKTNETNKRKYTSTSYTGTGNGKIPESSSGPSS